MKLRAERDLRNHLIRLPYFPDKDFEILGSTYVMRLLAVSSSLEHSLPINFNLGQETSCFNLGHPLNC